MEGNVLFYQKEERDSRGGTGARTGEHPHQQGAGPSRLHRSRWRS